MLINQLIKTDKFSNMIGYHQPNLSAYRTLYNYACMLDSARIMPVKLDSMRHVHALIMHFADLTFAHLIKT